MTALFTAERREEVLSNLSTFFRADEYIAGLVQVGSGAYETQDKYSGIDLLVVVSNGAVFASVYRKWRERLCDLLPVVHHFELYASLDQATYILLLDDYLEINLYFWRMRNLKANQKPWRVLFDQSTNGEIEAILQTTYQEERIAAPSRAYKKIMERIWHPIVKCVTALNRGESWRALHMLEQIRNQAIELAAMNYGVDTRNYTEVDKLPEMLLIQLRHTLPTDTNGVAIRRALRTTLSLFFMQALELEQKLDIELAQELKDRFMLYVEAYAS